MDKNELIRLKNELVDRESFQKYINEHKIRSADEFSKHSSTLYKRLNSLGFSREVTYYGNDKPKPPPHRRSASPAVRPSLRRSCPR